MMLAFSRWLSKNPLAGDDPFGKTGVRYQVARYCDFLEANPGRNGDPLKEARARDEAVTAYGLYLETFGHEGATERVLANLDHFYVFLGLGPVTRREAPAPSPLDASAAAELARRTG
jgi:hypothetical protein